MHDESNGSSFKLSELAEAAGVSPRTVRYYVQRGLLPAPVFRGRDTVYSDEHLLRLRAIRRMQEHYLPLDAIQSELERLSPEALQRLAEGGEVGTQVSAADTGPPGAVMVELLQEAPVGPASSHLVPDAASTSRWERWVLAPGLELHVADEADPATRALAEALRAHAARREGHYGGRQ